MNVQRFTGRNAREAMAKVRTTLGVQAVVLANRPIPEGVEILAIPGTDMPASDAAVPAHGEAGRKPAPRSRVVPMSTMSFENYVRERQKQQDTRPCAVNSAEGFHGSPIPEAQPEALRLFPANAGAGITPDSGKNIPMADMGHAVMHELRAMQTLLSSQLSSLSWFDSVRRSPMQTQLLRLLLGSGFSPGLARRLIDRLPADLGDAESGDWLRNVITQNLRCTKQSDAIAHAGGVYALVGPTGVGKTTTTAKIAANFALTHGAASVGLITMDTYRMAASDQLRAFGRLLGIPVHTARDAASLGDLLDLFEKKKLVLIDTVGAGQRDHRLSDIFSCLPAERVTRLVVLNATAQTETLDEVARAYGTGPGTRCVLTKLDEAVQSGGVLDVAVRHQLVVEGFANGQRVPEDWHSARPQLLTQKALMKRAGPVFMTDEAELGLMMTTPADRDGGYAGSMHA